MSAWESCDPIISELAEWLEGVISTIGETSKYRYIDELENLAIKTGKCDTERAMFFQALAELGHIDLIALRGKEHEVAPDIIEKLCSYAEH